MLTELTLHNFKSWKSIDRMRLAPITGLFGTNSSGKTSILQLLLLLKQTVQSSDRMQVLDFGGDDRDLIELGSFRDVIHAHTPASTFEWEFAWKLPDALKVRDVTKKESPVVLEDKSLRFHCAVKGSDHSSQVRVEHMSYTLDKTEFSMCRVQDEEYGLSARPESRYKLKRCQGRAWPLPPPVKCYGFPDQARNYYQNAGFLSDFELAFEQLFSRVFYLGPLRDYPRRQYVWGGGQPDDMGRKGEKVVDAILSSRDRGQKFKLPKRRAKATLEECLAYWLRELKLIEEFDVKPVAKGSNLYQVHVRRQAESHPVLITDVGFGISQILPVLAICYYVPEGSTVVLEQPEIHLHPSVQSGLADVFIEVIKSRSIQIILESHSEHLLRRMQRRVAEESLRPDDCALYFCDIDHGESKLRPLQLDLFGNIRNWPKDFFGDELGEMAAMTEAKLRRMQGAAK
jgi:predicted ATPase